MTTTESVETKELVELVELLRVGSGRLKLAILERDWNTVRDVSNSMTSDSQRLSYLAMKQQEKLP